MQIFFPKEEGHEIRATILPEVAKKFTDLGIEVLIEAGLGEKVFVSDEQYVDAGATVCKEKKEGFGSADGVCKINQPTQDEIQSLKKNSI